MLECIWSLKDQSLPPFWIAISLSRWLWSGECRGGGARSSPASNSPCSIAAGAVQDIHHHRCVCVVKSESVLHRAAAAAVAPNPYSHRIRDIKMHLEQFSKKSNSVCRPTFDQGYAFELRSSGGGDSFKVQLDSNIANSMLSRVCRQLPPDRTQHVWSSLGSAAAVVVIPARSNWIRTWRIRWRSKFRSSLHGEGP